MTGQFPGTQPRADLQVVRDGGDTSTTTSAASTTGQAVGLLENARKVADATIAEARDEAERLLAAARERAQQVQRDAKELGHKLRADAERETAEAKHAAYGEAERIVADARSEVSSLKASLDGLRAEQSAAESTLRQLSERLQGLMSGLTHRDGDHDQQQY
jgi:vacuolar-type H+-ATPase subunit H